MRTTKLHQIPKEESEDAKRRRTDNTQTNRKRIKHTNNDLQNTTEKSSD